MSMIQIKQGRAWVRLDRYTHQALAECYAEYPHPLPASTSQFAKSETKLTDWNMAQITLADSRINDGRPPESAFKLNAFGLAWAKALPPMSRDRRTLPPLFPLADVLAELPQGILDWLSGPPPIAKLPGGIMFEALGVLLPAPRGDGLIPSNELLLAFDELAQRKQGGRSFTPETRVTVEYAPELCAFLTQTTILPGVAWKSSHMDGRQLRPFNMTEDGAGMIQLVRDGDVDYWRCSYEMRAVTAALASGERDGFTLARLCPQRFQDWLASGLSDVMRPAKHCRLLAVLGLIRRKGKFDWRLTDAGKHVVPMLAAAIRAEATGELAPDDSAYEGSGVDIMLPSDPPAGSDGPSDLDLSFGAWPDGTPIYQTATNPWDILGEMTGSPPDPVMLHAADEDGYIPVGPSDEVQREAEKAARAPGVTVVRDGGPQGRIMALRIKPAAETEATTAALDSMIAVAREAERIIEAPTPPFTKDGGGYRITPDISATDDEFDIL